MRDLKLTANEIIQLEHFCIDGLTPRASAMAEWSRDRQELDQLLMSDARSTLERFRNSDLPNELLPHNLDEAELDPKEASKRIIKLGEFLKKYGYGG
jgi:hypothetical protein